MKLWFQKKATKAEEEHVDSAPDVTEKVPDRVDTDVSSLDTADDDVVVAPLDVEVFEHQRYNDATGWSHENLLTTDPKRYMSAGEMYREFPDVEINPDYTFTGDWAVDKDIPGCVDGWMYAESFRALAKNDINRRTEILNAAKGVRRRRWVRSQKPKEQLSPLMTATKGATGAETKPVAATTPEAKGKPKTVGWGWGSKKKTSKPTEVEDDGDSDDGASQKSKETSRSASPQPSRSFFGFGGADKSKIDPDLIYKDETLKASANMIKTIEDEARKADNAFMKDFIDNRKPVLRKEIAAAKAAIKVLKQRIEKEVYLGFEFVKDYEEQLKVQTEKLEAMSKEKHLPKSKIVLGNDGVYVGIDDIWIEQVSGSFLVDLMPNGNRQDKPIITLILSGSERAKLHTTSNSAQSPNPEKVGKHDGNGVIVKIKVVKLKIVGDKGKGVPKLSFDTISLTLALRVNVCLVFDPSNKKWDSKVFKIEILSLKGPYGLNRSVASLVVSLATPAIRNLVVKDLPVELGEFIHSFPSPFSVRGEFDIRGTKISNLTEQMVDNILIQELCGGYTRHQMEMFQGVQLCMDRSRPMKTIADVMAYRNEFKRQPQLWKEIVMLWNQALREYSRELLERLDEKHRSKASRDSDDAARDSATAAEIDFDGILGAADDLMRKQFAVDFKLNHLDGRISLNKLAHFIHEIVHRTSTEAAAKAKGFQKARLMLQIDANHKSYETALEGIDIFAANMDFAQLCLKLGLRSGSKGTMRVTINDILAQAPLSVSVAMKSEKNMGQLPLVPHMVHIQPRDNGDLEIDINQVSHKALDTNSQIKFEEFHIEVDPFDEDDDEEDDMDGMYDVQRSLWETRREVEQTLAAQPQGEIAHRVISVVVSSPTVSMVTDSPMSVKAGAELFTVKLGPRERDYQPYDGRFTNVMENDATAGWTDPPDWGRKSARLAVTAEEALRMISAEDDAPPSAIRFESSTEYEEDLPALPSPSRRQTTASRRQTTTRQPKTPTPCVLGCPIFVSTTNCVKFMAQVPKVDVTIFLADLMRFIFAHVIDLDALQKYTNRAIGGRFTQEHMKVPQIIVDRIAKYLLLPGLRLSMNLIPKIVTRNGEIVVAVETPLNVGSGAEDENAFRQTMAAPGQEQGGAGSDMGSRSADGSSVNVDNFASFREEEAKSLHAILFHGQFRVLDIIEDCNAIGECIRAALESTEVLLAADAGTETAGDSTQRETKFFSCKDTTGDSTQRETKYFSCKDAGDGDGDGEQTK